MQINVWILVHGYKSLLHCVLRFFHTGSGTNSMVCWAVTASQSIYKIPVFKQRQQCSTIMLPATPCLPVSCWTWCEENLCLIFNDLLSTSVLCAYRWPERFVDTDSSTDTEWLQRHQTKKAKFAAVPVPVPVMFANTTPAAASNNVTQCHRSHLSWRWHALPPCHYLPSLLQVHIQVGYSFYDVTVCLTWHYVMVCDKQAPSNPELSNHLFLSVNAFGVLK